MTPSEQITERIASYQDWRGIRLAELREIIHAVAPELTEGWKWDVPVWLTPSGKLVCAISAFKDHVKINFFQGAQLPDPTGLFNSGLDSKAHRSINLAESDKINAPALREVIVAAIAYTK